MAVFPPVAATLMDCAGETVSTGCFFSSSTGGSTPGSLLQEKQRDKSNITIVMKSVVFIGCCFFVSDK
jgi:hypothetical protein